MGIGPYTPTAFIYICMGMLKPQHKTQPTNKGNDGGGGGGEEGTNAPPIISGFHRAFLKSITFII